MKKIRFALGFLATALIFISCSQDDRSFVSIAEAEGMIPGLWKVDYYNDNGGDAAGDYSNYTFDFNSDGTLVASDGAESFDGIWSIDITNEDPTYDQMLQISITGNDLLQKLAQDWLVTEITGVRLNLLDDNGTEELYLLKN